MPRKSYRSPESTPTRMSIPHPHRAGEYLPVRRTSLRMPGIDYAAASCVCFVTFILSHTTELRFDGAIGVTGWNALNDVHQHIEYQLISGVLMPDHVHLLLAPSGRGETVSDIVGRTKRWIQRRINEEHRQKIYWQRSFYDRIIRATSFASEEVLAISQYIRQNPYRARIISAPDRYPFVFPAE